MLSGISIPSLLIILAIVLLLFGTKKLKNLGGDLGGAIKGFKKALTEEEKNAVEKQEAETEMTGNQHAESTEEKQNVDSK